MRATRTGVQESLLWTRLWRCPVGNRNRSKERGSWLGARPEVAGISPAGTAEWLTRGSGRDVSQRWSNRSTGGGMSTEGVSRVRENQRQLRLNHASNIALCSLKSQEIC